MSPAAARTKLVSAASLAEGAGALAQRRGGSSDRPALRPDLIIRRQVQMGEVFWLVKNPETQKLYSFNDEMWDLLHLFDGQRTRAEIAAHYNATHSGEPIGLTLVADFEAQLKDLECLVQSSTERNLELLSKSKTARKRAADEKAEGFNPFFIQFHVIDPDGFMNRTVRYVRWLWSPPAVAVSLVLYALAIGVIVNHFGPIWSQTLQLYNFFGKPFWDFVQFFFILTCIGAIHEYAHGYVCKMYGGEVHDIGMALLYFTPAFYCDTTDALLFDSRWKRIWVTTAGMYVEGLMCTIATGLWVATYPDTLVHEVAYKTMLFTGISTVFFNINPLIKIDGYYALTHLTQDPNLREGAFQYLGAWIQRHVLRLNVDVPSLPRRKKWLYAIYGVLASWYAALVMFFIGHLFSNLYRKYFPDVAGALLAVTLYQVFKKRIRVVTRLARLFYLDKKEYLMSPSIRRRGALALGALLLVLFVPWSERSVQAPVTLIPDHTMELHSPADAIVRDVFVRGGEAVRPGQPLFALASIETASRVAELAAERRRLGGEARGSREAGRPDVAFAAAEKLTAADAAYAREIGRETHLTIDSAEAARVLTPHPEELRGRTVAAGDLLATLGRCDFVRAEIPVTERLLTNLTPGESVAVQLNAQPLTTLRGTVIAVGPAPAPGAADSASDAVNADVERPTKFIAVARFDNASGRLIPGMTGIGRISLGRSSYVMRAFGVVRRWIGTIFWG